jgi:hypothetical protein
MKRAGWFTRIAILLAAAGMSLPQAARADFPIRPAAPAPLSAPPTSAPAPIADIALDDGGVLHGQVVDGQGIALADLPVLISQQKWLVATTRTDQDGRFTVSGLRGGAYQIAAGQGSAICRLWAAHTAPPAAQSSAMVVSGRQTVRGQGPGSARYWLTNPWILAGLIGAAIIVPIALDNRAKVSTS